MAAAGGAPRRTPLHAAHRRLGARLVDFAGWEMPVSYSGILPEHHAVRTAAGLFDVSHMGEVEVSGPGALDTCQRLVTNDASRLAIGSAQYAVLCLPSGGIVDDLVYYRRSEDRFLFCVNASNAAKDHDWMREHRGGAEVRDASDDYALLALQGPKAAAVLAPLTRADLSALRSFEARETTVADVAVLLSRTGYTGEDGFEIFVEPSRAERLWDVLLDAGGPQGLLPAGLGARDTLRLEKGLLLYGNDLSEETTPLEAGLGWVVKLGKGDFLGRDALVRQKAEGLRRKLVGLVSRDPAPPRHGYPVLRDGERVGEVTSGTRSPTLGHGVALAYVEISAADVGTALAVEIRGRQHPALVVKPPFVERREASPGGGAGGRE